MIKRALAFLFAAVTIVHCTEPNNSLTKKEIVPVATALNHLTVFEFGEPVVNAAAGSTTFQIEWKENKVYVKPLKAGASTDLFIWTASRRFDYELEAPGEVKDMNFVVENPAPTPTPQSTASQEQIDEVTNSVLTGAMMDLDRVNHGAIRNVKRGITVRIESVFQSKSSLYVRYSILNLGDRPYRVITPRVTRIAADHPEISLIALRNTQLDHGQVRRLGPTYRNILASVAGESRTTDLKRGDETHGVVAIRGTVTGLTVLELAFGAYGDQQVTATFVF